MTWWVLVLRKRSLRRHGLERHILSLGPCSLLSILATVSACSPPCWFSLPQQWPAGLRLLPSMKLGGGINTWSDANPASLVLQGAAFEEDRWTRPSSSSSPAFSLYHTLLPSCDTQLQAPKRWGQSATGRTSLWPVKLR